MIEVVLGLIYLGTLLYASITDWKELIVKDRVHIIIILLGLIPYQTVLSHLIGAMVITVPFLVFAVKTDKLGGGDVKFIFANTVLLGFKESYTGMLAGLTVLILVFYMKKVLCGIGSKRIAFIPFLSLGYIVVFVLMKPH